MTRHIPVLLAEVLELLDPRPGEVFIDCTVGAAGHALPILERLGPTGWLIGLDQDPFMLDLARSRLPPRTTPPRATLVHRNFENLPAVLDSLGLLAVDGILADLGFSSDQLADPARGLSFRDDGPLDMRLDPTVGQPASELLNRLPERELADLFWRYGEERHSRKAAKWIAHDRQTTPFTTTGQLAGLLRRCIPRSRGHAIDPATRVFQALRVAVNDELGALERFLQVVPACLKPGGRVAIISFHSLEDRLVKQAFRKSPDLFKERTRKPRQASEAEMQDNPRARSAKLRVAERL